MFDPERLHEIVSELGSELKSTSAIAIRGLRNVPAVTAVDGSLLSVLPRLMQASFLKHSTGSGLVKWRLHTHFEVDRHVPTRIDVTPWRRRSPRRTQAVLEPHDRSGSHLRDGPRLRQVLAVQ